MRFLVDMNRATDVAVWLRAQGHDAVHLRDLGLQELGDKAVLAKAVAEKRLQRVLASAARSLDEGAVVLVEQTRQRVRRLPIGR